MLCTCHCLTALKFPQGDLGVPECGYLGVSPPLFVQSSWTDRLLLFQHDRGDSALSAGADPEQLHLGYVNEPWSCDSISWHVYNEALY